MLKDHVPKFIFIMRILEGSIEPMFMSFGALTSMVMALDIVSGDIAFVYTSTDIYVPASGGSIVRFYILPHPLVQRLHVPIVDDDLRALFLQASDHIV
jgi:hypothetical protein